MAQSISSYNPKGLLDFRDPVAVQIAREQSEVTCATYGGNDERCHQTRKMATDIQRLYMCNHTWSPECADVIQNLEREYGLNFRINCDRGWYTYSDPKFQQYICRGPTQATFPSPWGGGNRVQYETEKGVVSPWRGLIELRHRYNQNNRRDFSGYAQMGNL